MAKALRDTLYNSERETFKEKYNFYKLRTDATLQQTTISQPRGDRSIHVSPLKTDENSTVHNRSTTTRNRLPDLRHRRLDQAKADLKSLQGAYESKQHHIFLALMQHDFNQLFYYCCDLLQICVVQQYTSKFIEILLFLSNMAFEEKKIDTSVFLMNQGLILSEIFQQYHHKIYCLIGLAQACRSTSQYQWALQFLNKGLQYALMSRNYSAEVIIYDLIGLTYYYLGNIEKANMFHQRFLKAKVEPEHSYFRDVSSKYVEFYEQNVRYLSKQFDKVVMVKLSMPILNPFEDDLMICDQFKTVTVFNCSMRKIIKSILASKEYTQFDFNYPEQQPAHEGEIEPEIGHQAMPRHIIRIKARMRSKHLGPEMVAGEKDDSLQSIWDRIQQHAQSNSLRIEKRQEHVFLRHLKNNTVSKHVADSLHPRRLTQLVAIVQS